eukprot:6466009-Amphidinium_carterae.2
MDPCTATKHNRNGAQCRWVPLHQVCRWKEPHVTSRSELAWLCLLYAITEIAIQKGLGERSPMSSALPLVLKLCWDCWVSSTRRGRFKVY